MASWHLIASLTLALMTACAGTAAAANCAGGWLALGNGVLAAPMLGAAEHPQATLVVDRCGADGEDVEWAEGGVSGRGVIATGVLRRTQSGLDLQVTARTGDSFVIAQRLQAPVIEAIDGARTRYAAGRGGAAQRFYPYDWNTGRTEGVREQNAAMTARARPATTAAIDLALPGVHIGSLYYVEASDELARIDLVTFPTTAEARLFLTTAEPSPNGDGADIHRNLRPGERVDLSVLVATDLKTIDDAKWGRSPPMAERIADVPFKNWASEGYNLPAADYRLIAQHLKGGFDSVILRTMAPEKWVADIFKEQGLRVYLYQYWAAVRVLDNKGTLPRGVDPGWALRETGGAAGYTAPTPNGAWQILDVRRPEVRAYFVKVARDAVVSSWDGVFYDGSYFWADTRGRVGGAVARCAPATADCMSFALGRAKMLTEVKRAIEAVNPSAKVGVLSGLRYTDQLHIADYVSREAVNVGWTKLLSQPLLNQARYSPTLSAKWLREEEPYFTENLVWGTKSANPLLDKSSIYWAVQNPRNYGIDVSDFYPKDAAEFAQALGDAGRYFAANRIVRLAPADAMIFGTGPSLIEVSKPVAIALEHPAPAFDMTAGRYLGNTDTYRLDPQSRYVIAERPAAGDVHFSGEYFAWFAPDLYLAGDLRFTGPPTRTGDGIAAPAVAIGDGAMALWSPRPPRSISADGEVINFTYDRGAWRFTMPKNMTGLKIAF